MTEKVKPTLQTKISSNFSPDIVPKSKTGLAAEARTLHFKIAPLGLTFAAAPADALARAKTRGRRNEYNPHALEVNDVVITVTDDKGIKSLGVAASKMLSAGIMAFTAENSQGQAQPHLRVTLDTADYARKNGWEIEPRQMPTPEAQAAEDKRAENDAHNFLAKARRNLHTIRTNAAFSWTETVKGRTEAYSEINFISGFRVTRKAITMDFGLAAAEYLAKRPMRQRPDAMFLVDENRENAYAIGEYLNQHYSIDANVSRGTECMISIEAVLKQTSYPTIDAIRQGKSKRTWRDIIKERLESDLDHLTQIGVLTTWAYSHPKKKLLTDDEAANIATYEEYAELYLCYEIANYPPHGERVKAIRAKTEKSAKRASMGRGRKRKAEGGE